MLSCGVYMMKAEPPPHPNISITRDQFFSSYQMLETLVEVCPDDVWYGVYNEVPFWYQVYHTVYFVDYWFRTDQDGAGFPSMPLDPRIPPEFEREVPAGLSISRESMRAYLRLIREKLTQIFASIKKSDLSSPVFAQEPEVTLMDAIFSQTRHIMFNIGYCNGILRQQNLPEADWYAYNESDS